MPPRPIGPVLTLHHPETAKLYYEQGLWCPDTFHDLAMKHARERPSDWAIRAAERHFRYHLGHSQ